MRITPITNSQCNYQSKHKNIQNSNIAFHGFWRDLKNMAGSALDTGVNFVTGQTHDPEKEFIDQMSIRETGYRVGEKERLEAEIAKKERRLKAERDEQERLEKERLEIEKQKRIETLLKPHIETLENDFFSVIEASKKDSNIIPPNGILIETPEPFNIEYPYLNHKLLTPPIRRAIEYCVMHRYFPTENTFSELIEKFAEEENFERLKIIEYEKKQKEYDDRIILQNLIYDYISSKENINKFLIIAESLSQIKSSLENGHKAYLDNGKHSLIKIENFGKIGTSIEDNKRIIAALKSILCTCAEKYHTTVLIKIAKDKIQSIDPILLVDSRMPIKIKL